MRRPLLAFTLVTVVTVIVDQASKALVRALLPVGESATLIPHVFYLTHVRNAGAAFGLLQGRQPLFVIVTMGVLAGVALWFWRTRGRTRPWEIIVALGLISGGAVGNLLDRMILTRVTDFFDAAFINFPVFNVADTAIFCGTGLLVFWLVFSEQPDEASAEAGECDTPTLLSIAGDDTEHLESESADETAGEARVADGSSRAAS